MTWRVYLEDQPWAMASRLHMARYRGDKIDVVQPLEMKTIEAGLMVQNSVGIFGDVARAEAIEFLQAIMDAAWEQGIRPTNHQDHTNELTAVRFRLEDMRRLALPSVGEPTDKAAGDGTEAE